ncbi:RNA-binding protein 48 [Trichonephila inaurata madagascariensis]|uniref:RNA-binding protein 48 n=1 Tax=Trichonephila inaurata madagascariensis TaxID=2747483 RepID=A0A8X7CDU3_9ARAC|nr:RNA-binding protein 48 [Trichonephila inaurata madagascariensis]
MEPVYTFKSISVYPHHIKQNVCGTRARYRDGRKERAVKVYTVNQESVYLMINNVPAVGAAENLRALCDQYGIVEDFRSLDDYPCEEFTEVYLVKFSLFNAARIAKKSLDDKLFFGCALHICYAPEFETVLETKVKLQERRKYVAWKTNSGNKQATMSSRQYGETSNNQTVVKQSSINTLAIQPVTYIWAGKEYTEYPKPVVEDVPIQKKPKSSPVSFVPRQIKSSSTCTTNSNGANICLNQGSKLVQRSLPHISESSYQNTITDVRNRISKVSVPNVRVSLKRKRRL